MLSDHLMGKWDGSRKDGCIVNKIEQFNFFFLKIVDRVFAISVQLNGKKICLRVFPENGDLIRSLLSQS